MLRRLEVITAAVMIFGVTAAPAHGAGEAKKVDPAAMYKSPQAVFDAYLAAGLRGDWRTVYSCYTPEARKQAVLSALYYCRVCGESEVAALRHKHIAADDDAIRVEYKKRRNENPQVDRAGPRHFDPQLYAEVVWSKTSEPMAFVEVWCKLMPGDPSELSNLLTNLKMEGDTAHASATTSFRLTSFHLQFWANVPRYFAPPISFRKVNNLWLISGD